MKICPFIISLTLVFMLVGCGTKNPNDPAFVVANVNGTKIYRRDLDKEEAYRLKEYPFLATSAVNQKAQLDQRVLDQLIRRTVLKKVAGAASEKVLNEAKVKFQQKMADPHYQKYVLSLGLDQDRIKQEIEDELTIKAYLDGELEKNAKKLEASETEAKAYYDTHLQEFQQAELTQARYIMVKASDGDEKAFAEKKNKIEDARSRILSKKEKFEDVAKAVSEDPITASAGGLTGKLTKPVGVIDNPFLKALFSQPLNEVGPIFTIKIPATATQKAITIFQFLQVVEKAPPHNQTFDEAKNQIIQRLTSINKSNFYVKAQQEVYSKATIKTFLPVVHSPIPSLTNTSNHLVPLPIKPPNISPSKQQ